MHIHRQCACYSHTQTYSDSDRQMHGQTPLYVCVCVSLCMSGHLHPQPARKRSFLELLSQNHISTCVYLHVCMCVYTVHIQCACFQLTLTIFEHEKRSDSHRGAVRLVCRDRAMQQIMSFLSGRLCHSVILMKTYIFRVLCASPAVVQWVWLSWLYNVIHRPLPACICVASVCSSVCFSFQMFMQTHINAMHADYLYLCVHTLLV